jgi:putative oxidoreductase
MGFITSTWERLTGGLNAIGDWIAPLALRIILFWEFYDAGMNKVSGENWFGSIQGNFLFPFNVVPPDISWFLATWTEVIGGIMILVGLFTRFWAVSLFILTIVAIGAVHWGVGDVWSGDIRAYESFSEMFQGYAISNKGFGNYKLPLLYMVMFLPLILNGPGKASLDHFIRRRMIGD